ncbi:MAG: alpha/beta fold hydrolase [Bacteroidota bacterium]
MKKLILFNILLFGQFSINVIAQTIDTLMNVGNGYQMHFTIIKGHSSPILFESGFGNGADVWKDITKQVSDVTGASVIMYDRLSYTSDLKSYQIGIENEIKALENGLHRLGFSSQNIMLVSHSLGGMYNSYYASRHSKEVKAAVFIDDANVCSLTSHFNMIDLTQKDTIEQYLASVLNTVKNNPMPKNIPLIDIVADTHVDDNGNPDNVWVNCHKNFVAESPSRKILLAYNVGHYVFVENPQLVINTIITQYANYLEPKRKGIILEKGYDLLLNMVNESKKNEVKCGHSEDDLITWGYSYLEKNEIEKAIRVFELNVLINPNGWNNYDSLGEAYLKAGNRDQAIKNYKKSLELNPKNDAAIKVLEKIQ